MPQRRRRAHGFSGQARRARDAGLGLATGLLLLGLVATPVAADTGELDAEAASLVAVFDDAFCFLVPPRPLSGIFEPADGQAAALARDHAFARRLEASLRRAAPFPVVSLAPSHPFDASRMRVIEPTLLRILTSVLRLYADVWQAARAVVVDRSAPALPALALQPLRNACDPAVVLFVFTDHSGAISAAGYVSLLTGRLLAAWPPPD